MITHFDDFCLWAYVVIDEIWQQICPLFTHPGPQSLCTDSELLTLALVGECRGWDKGYQRSDSACCAACCCAICCSRTFCISSCSRCTSAFLTISVC